MIVHFYHSNKKDKFESKSCNTCFDNTAEFRKLDRPS